MTSIGETETVKEPEVKRMMWNILVISLAFTLLFTAYQSTANLQSSLNIDAGLGTASLSTIYAALILSCVFVPTYMISKLTVKWTMPICMLGYVAYIAAQYSPSFYSLIPTAALVGLSAAPLWSAKCTYLTHVGTLKAKLENKSSVTQITRLFGIFFMFFQCSQIIGNLISSTVLSSGVNKPIDPNDPSLDICGAVYCPWSPSGNGTVGEKPEQSKVTLLFSIYLGCAVAAAITVAVLVDPLTRFGDRVGSATGLSGLKLLAATVKHLKDHRQVLLIPLTVFSGLEQGYIQADFTLSFITCAYGIQNVGYVMICFGVCDAIFSFAFGEIIKIVGRVPIFTLGAALNLSLICTMFIWKPTPNEPAVFFVLAGLWGISDAVWQTQINALYGNLFPNNEEAAFSNYRLWESLGFLIAYIYSTLICINAKLWVLIVVLITGMAGYYTVELLEHRKKNKDSISAQKTS